MLIDHVAQVERQIREGERHYVTVGTLANGKSRGAVHLKWHSQRMSMIGLQALRHMTTRNGRRTAAVGHDVWPTLGKKNGMLSLQANPW